MLGRFLVASTVLTSACQAHDLSGSWALCLNTSSSFTCGTANVQPAHDMGTGLAYTTYYPLTYKVDLHAILDSSHCQRSRCGSVLVAEDGSITVQLGIRCDATWEADGGGLYAEHLTLAGDSVSGRWYQGCFSGCSAHGQLTMRRAR